MLCRGPLVELSLLARDVTPKVRIGASLNEKRLYYSISRKRLTRTQEAKAVADFLQSGDINLKSSKCWS